MKFSFSGIFVLIATLYIAINFSSLRINAEDAVATEASPTEAVVEDGVLMDGISAEDEKKIEESKESFGFQAEVGRLLDIIINSLYKNRDVFLRELISNASDAIDKIRFLSVSNTDILGDTKEFGIWVSFNEKLKTLTIRDTGIGMTQNDLKTNLGTLAKSGTKNFLEALSKGGDMGLIGQFGVGFYSAFLVADKVRVVTKNPEDDQYIWESAADNQFTIAKDPRGNTLGRGTEITLFLKEEAEKYLRQENLHEVITVHSEFITFPIHLWWKTMETVELPEEESEEEAVEESKEPKVDEDGLEVAEEEEAPKEPKKPKTEQREKFDWKRMNKDTAIWSRPKEEITTEEYKNFYVTLTKEAYSHPASWIHFKAEGEVEFRSIIYIPTEPHDLYDNYQDKKPQVKLYVRKVLIQSDFEDLLPKYLNFIKGVVDSDDLPLNVSRETLQQHKILKVMAKKIVRKVLEMLRKLAAGKKLDGDDKGDDEDTEGEDKSSSEGESEEGQLALNDPEHPYIKFYEQFSKSLKMGIMEDRANKSKLAKLLRFKSSKSNGKYVSLDEYVSNMPSWQKDIYFIAAETLDGAMKSPFMESARKKGVEVLYLVEAIDEYAFQTLADFDGHKLQSMTKDGLKFGDEDEDTVKKRVKQYRQNYKPLTKFLKNLLSGKVTKVTVSQRVETSPSIIVTSQFGYSANMERIAKAQTLNNPEVHKQQQSTKTLELNPRHPLIAQLNELVQSKPDAKETTDLAYVIYDTALLVSGFQHDDVEDFSARMQRILANSLNVKSMELLDEIEVDEDDDEEEDSSNSAAGEHDEF